MYSTGSLVPRRLTPKKERAAVLLIGQTNPVADCAQAGQVTSRSPKPADDTPVELIRPP
jgi:hypothetical protein